MFGEVTVYSSLLQLIRKLITTLKPIIKQSITQTPTVPFVDSTALRLGYSFKTRRFLVSFICILFSKKSPLLHSGSSPVNHQTLEVSQSIAQSKFKDQNSLCSKAQGQSNTGQQDLGKVTEFFFFFRLVSNFKPLAFGPNPAPQQHKLASWTKKLKVLPSTFPLHYPYLLLCQRKQKPWQQISCVAKGHSDWIPLHL